MIGVRPTRYAVDRSRGHVAGRHHRNCHRRRGGIVSDDGGDCGDAYALAKEMRGFAKTVSLMPRLHELESPTYLRVGELDVPTPAAHSRGIAQRIPNSRLDVCAGRGHLLQVEEPTHTAEALLRFLAAID